MAGSYALHAFALQHPIRGFLWIEHHLLVFGKTWDTVSPSKEESGVPVHDAWIKYPNPGLKWKTPYAHQTRDFNSLRGI